LNLNVVSSLANPTIQNETLILWILKL
jgi:hypothetical protein